MLGEGEKSQSQKSHFLPLCAFAPLCETCYHGVA